MSVSRSLVVTGLILMGALALAGWAEGSPAALASVAASSSPSVQGVGGTVTVQGAADLWGACCGVTESTGMVAKLTLSAGLELVSGDNPQSLPDVTIPPGKGGAATGRWKVRADSEGDFSFKVRISSDASGAAEGTASIKFVRGPVISEATIFPGKPVPQQAVSVSAQISSPVGIKGAVLSYSKGQEWSPVQMDLQAGDTWTALLPRFDEGTVSYRISAQDNDGVTLESSQAQFSVLDYPRISRGVNLITVAGSVSALAVTAVVLAGFWLVRVRWGRPAADAPGLHIVGSDRVDTSLDGSRPEPKRVLRSARMRAAFVAVIVVVSFLLMAWGMASGQYEQMYNYMKPPWW